MNNIAFLRGQGGVVKSLPGEDHYSALLVYMGADADLPKAQTGGFTPTNRILPISNIEQAESLGIKADAPSWYIKTLHYHLSEIFRINPAIMLWVGLYTKPAANYTYNEIKLMQQKAEGKIRQIGVWTPDKEIAAAEITTLQGQADYLEGVDMPLSIIYSPKIVTAAALMDVSASNKKNISVVIAQDGDGIGNDLYKDASNATKATVGIVSIALATLSKAAVHESIGWVQKFPSGIETPAFGDGVLLKDTPQAIIEELQAKRFLFLVKYGALTGSYFNDNHTMDLARSDYAYISAVRTMDKAIRGIRTYLLPYLSSPIYVDADSGRLDAGSCKFLEELSGRQLEDMERAGELSGYSVWVDPNQNILNSSSVEFVIKQVEVGVMRNMRVKIGYTTKLDQ